MKWNDLARRLASETKTSPGAAADQLDQVVHRILQALKSGKSTELPGLGKFTPVNDGCGFRFEPWGKKAPRAREKR